MSEIKVCNIHFLSDNEDNLKVINQSQEDLEIIFSDPSINYNGYTNKNFKSGYWVSTNYKVWDNIGKGDEIIIKVKSNSTILKVIYNKKTKELINKTDNFLKVKNDSIIFKKMTILLAAYKADKYIDETLDKFIEIIKDKEHLDVEIIILIDGCNETLKHISKKVYPDFIKVYLSYENYGLSVTKNTLVNLCTNDKFILFDPDDIPKSNLIDMVHDELDNSDIVYYTYSSFKDGFDFNLEENLTKEKNNFMGGTFGMNKKKFLQKNGFFPWRVQSDDEFKHRISYDKNLKISVLKENLFLYRIRIDSLSKNKKTTDGSILRDTYREIISDNIHNKKFENPNDFKINKDIVLLQ